MMPTGLPSFPSGERCFGLDTSLRDYFAAHVATGLIASPITDKNSVRDVACTAYEIADAMMAARLLQKLPTATARRTDVPVLLESGNYKLPSGHILSVNGENFSIDKPGFYAAHGVGK